jgi:hypothetical protein
MINNEFYKIIYSNEFIKEIEEYIYVEVKEINKKIL